jgi:hypothetical protein
MDGCLACIDYCYMWVQYYMGTVLVVWLLLVVIASAAWEMRRVVLAQTDVTSKAWQERHTLLRKQLEHHPASNHPASNYPASNHPASNIHDQFNRRLAQAAAYAHKHNTPPEHFLDATTAREVRIWQQQQTLAEAQTRQDMQQRVYPQRHRADP